MSNNVDTSMDYIKVGGHLETEEKRDKKIHFHENRIIFEVGSKPENDHPGWYFKAGIPTPWDEEEWADKLDEIPSQGYSINEELYKGIKSSERYRIKDLVIHDTTADLFFAVKDLEMAETTKVVRPGRDKKAGGAVDFWVFPVYAFIPVMIRDTQNLVIDFREKEKQATVDDSPVYFKSEYETLKCPDCENVYSTPEDFREHLKDHVKFDDQDGYYYKKKI